MLKEALVFVFLVYQLQHITSDGLQGNIAGCKQKNNCHECITDPTLCVWCSADNLKLGDRCQPVHSEQAKTCSAEYSHSPKSNVTVHAHDSLDFTSASDHAIQIKPQKIKMKLRVGEEMRFHFHYKAVENYPVDLYFLLDASNSMKRIRDGISKKSKDIYDSMYNLTTNIYLGYGTFIDKNIFPFNNNMSNKCYSFKHNLKPTPILEEFQNALNETEFGSNYDFPESGLDGIAQVMACNKQIEFRSQSRKVIIMITDDRSHFAGDGHAAGIINPYDGQCYLDDKGYYTKETEMDYPSVGMINKMVVEDQFTIIFVVKAEYSEAYQVLADAIPGALVSTYNDNTISEKLNNFYKHISNNIRLDVYMLAEDKDKFEMTFDPDCNKMDCAVELGEELRIDGLIKLKDYYGKDNISIPIVPKGLKEAMTLDIDIISRCSCELKDDVSYQVNSSDCNTGGNLQCGICDCHKDRTGPTCACIVDNATLTADTTPCVKDGVECSSNGNCICGSCMCRPGFAGHYCEVRTDDCQRDDTGALCSGHGRCWNGTCQCIKDAWEGDKCECSKSTDLCTDANGNVCNNRGHCKCESCKCDPLPKWDVRDDTDDLCHQSCDDCHTRQCLALIDCVACHYSNNTEDCIEECGENLSIVTDVEDLNSFYVCANARVSFGCYANFSYYYDDDAHEITLYRLMEPNCNESYYKYGGISLLSAIIAGVVTMWAWKLVTDAHDRAEYERFLRTPDDEDDAVENPSYVKPTNSFRNPNFKRSFTFR